MYIFTNCVIKASDILVNVGSGREATTRTNADVLLIEPPATHLSEIRIESKISISW